MAISDKHGQVLPRLLRGSQNQVGLCVLTVLGWLGGSDGRMAPEEERSLRDIARASGNHADVQKIISATRTPHIRDLQLACEVLRGHLTLKHRVLFLQLAIGLTAADGRLAVGENHILRFLADLFGVSPFQFDALFREMTGRDFSWPGDPGSAAWWDERERAEQSQSASPSSGTGRRVSALAALGLDENASPQDIRSGFRRLARVNHPDRFYHLGPEAVEAAHITFRRIREAYEYLLAS